MFALSGVEATTSGNLIRGTCFINNTHLITIIDTGATYSFIYAKCVSRLKLDVFSRNDSMIIHTSVSGSMTISLVCLNCPMTILGIDFGMNLVCLPLIQLDVILRMNWFGLNHGFINCFDKSVQFLDSIESLESSFMTARHVETSLSQSAQVFMVLASLTGGSERTITDLPVMCDFPEVFPNDIIDFPPQREV